MVRGSAPGARQPTQGDGARRDPEELRQDAADTGAAADELGRLGGVLDAIQPFALARAEYGEIGRIGAVPGELPPVDGHIGGCGGLECGHGKSVGRAPRLTATAVLYGTGVTSLRDGPVTYGRVSGV
ncbi:hypothetical protein SCMC78_32820 [Streptomyces sp. CMC78]|uniref:Uncharacterized protein n=1 Tax=Streptomyces sp. CMC78 TaxID=3231512 RepID=A0AB33KL51_9ACTN